MQVTAQQFVRPIVIDLQRLTQDFLTHSIYHDVPYETQFDPGSVKVSDEMMNFGALVEKEKLQRLSRQVHIAYMRNKHTLMNAMAQALAEASRTGISEETGRTEYDAALEAVQIIINREAMYVYKDEVLRGVQQEEWKIRKRMMQQ